MQSKPPPPYGGAPYAGMPMEMLVKKRYVLALNGLGLVLIWIAVIFAVASGDITARGFGRFLTITGALLGAIGSLSAALGSRRTTDMQNLGLFIWAGLLMLFSAILLTLML